MFLVVLREPVSRCLGKWQTEDTPSSSAVIVPKRVWIYILNGREVFAVGLKVGVMQRLELLVSWVEM